MKQKKTFGKIGNCRPCRSWLFIFHKQINKAVARRKNCQRFLCQLRLSVFRYWKNNGWLVLHFRVVIGLSERCKSQVDQQSKNPLTFDAIWPAFWIFKNLDSRVWTAVVDACFNFTKSSWHWRTELSRRTSRCVHHLMKSLGSVSTQYLHCQLTGRSFEGKRTFRAKIFKIVVEGFSMKNHWLTWNVENEQRKFAINHHGACYLGGGTASAVDPRRSTGTSAEFPAERRTGRRSIDTMRLPFHSRKKEKAERPKRKSMSALGCIFLACFLFLKNSFDKIISERERHVSRSHSRSLFLNIKLKINFKRFLI